MSGLHLEDDDFLGDSEDYLGLEDEEEPELKLTELEEENIMVSEQQGPDKSNLPQAAETTLVKRQDEEDEISTDEEREILKGIRDEVENKVRGEMREELEAYKQRLKALTEGPANVEGEQEDLLQDEDMDPKLKEAIAKMKKLDKILKKKVRKEKEVKRDRLMLERRMRQEISEMQHGSSHYREIKVNTEKYLALEPPPSHNAGVQLEEDSDMPNLFQTQIDDAELLWEKEQNSAQDKDNESVRADSVSSNVEGSRAGSQAVSEKGKGKRRNKDFIKRNKELAADAAQPIAMTDDEKRRLQDLLEDVDDMPDWPEGENNDSLIKMDAFQVVATTGEGFCPDKGELKTLKDIDSCLKAILPEEDFLSVSFEVGPKHSPQPPLFSRVGTAPMGEIPERFGERVLYETKEERDLKARLQAIEQELDQFKAPQTSVDGEGKADFHLTDDQLDSLLNECVTSMSRMSASETPDLSARSMVSSRQALMENPPHLSEEQLQQLLSEAHFPLSSTLLALRDDDQKLEQEPGGTEAITAETWKAINEVNITEREQYLNQGILAGQNLSQNALDPPSSEVPGNGTIAEENIAQKSEVFNHHDRSLPQITSRSNSQIDGDVSSRSTPSVVDSSDSGTIRLPKIQSSSFLIQTTQGAKPTLNDLSKASHSEQSKSPLNDLSSRSINAEERRLKRFHNGVKSPAVPRPPSTDNPHQKPST